jgi:hypothetical protein
MKVTGELFDVYGDRLGTVTDIEVDGVKSEDATTYGRIVEVVIVRPQYDVVPRGLRTAALMGARATLPAREHNHPVQTFGARELVNKAPSQQDIERIAAAEAKRARKAAKLRK